MLASATQLAARSDYGLALMHLPVPHAPHAYDARTGRLTLANSPIGGYLDSLVLVDNTLASIRSAMERAGVWDGATILLSADHHYRASTALDGKTDPRVPFLLKMAGAHEPLAFDRPFNTVLTHDLILAVLRGEISSPRQAAAWLERRAASPAPQT
jgi:hypothetical protein